jgi:hypothetical protein
VSAAEEGGSVVNLRQAAQQALEALEKVTRELLAVRDQLAERGGRPTTNVFHQSLWDSSFDAYTNHAIPVAEALCTALAEPEQEPPPKMRLLPCCGYHDGRAVFWNRFNGVVQCHSCGQQYAPHPPQRKPLTDEEIALIVGECAASAHRHDDFSFARAIERAHGIGGEA